VKTFASMRAFAAHIDGIVTAQAALERAALEQAARFVKQAIKAKLVAEPQARSILAGAAAGTLASIEHVIVDGGVAYIGSNSPIVEDRALGTHANPPSDFLGEAVVESMPAVEKIVSGTVFAALAGMGAEGVKMAVGAVEDGE
jgi:hypothetical protein